ncbi:SRPBCC family protein [Pseudalkalibacillus berkeleyi]|uniref:SRPBCC family protein n=1 Tax=Pseudalkalibacillus berkeleyi TaxID=1069813 RepID=A0ABS9GYH7_9BACL|nr:SRPBCC family protein [Pseudalkalibacillus berkeleyi]MCF6137794.1 SRPBCC family protein [Pseudalkalibacillus berkeleyi]
MMNVTKMKIFKPTSEVFEAFVDPSKIGHFWFSSSSERWEQGKTITLKYEEYGAQVDIVVLEMERDRKIVYQWGENVVTLSLEEMDNHSTVIEVTEEGFNATGEELTNLLIDNKEGWVYMLTCLKGYLEFGVTQLRASLVK